LGQRSLGLGQTRAADRAARRHPLRSPEPTRRSRVERSQARPNAAIRSQWILGGLLGHGLGLGACEPPYLGTPDLVSREEAYTLEPDMVFSVEPYAGIPG